MIPDVIDWTLMDFSRVVWTLVCSLDEPGNWFREVFRALEGGFETSLPLFEGVSRGKGRVTHRFRLGRNEKWISFNVSETHWGQLKSGFTLFASTRNLPGHHKR